MSYFNDCKLTISKHDGKLLLNCEKTLSDGVTYSCPEYFDILDEEMLENFDAMQKKAFINRQNYIDGNTNELGG